MVDLANGIRTAAPVIDLGRLTRVHARELQQRQSSDRILGEFNAFPEHARARPRCAMLDRQGDAMARRVRWNAQQDGARQRERTDHEESKG
jgi:hypothetical protein